MTRVELVCNGRDKDGRISSRVLACTHIICTSDIEDLPIHAGPLSKYVCANIIR